ncbi:MAG: hypothetical protein ACR2O6_13145 [Ilumatobacteraceae bacterium]
MLEPVPQITCIDCGGRCFLLTPAPEGNAWEVGDIVAYRCEDCLDRWDLELTEDDDPESHTPKF